MSGSTKSQSQMRTLVTDDFRDSHARIFGERKPARGRWVQDPRTGELVPAEEYAPEHEDGRTMVVSDLYMDGTRATDGTDIGSRRKRRDYMRRNDLADTSDFTEHWKKAEKARENFMGDAQSTRERRETIGRALYEAKTREKKKR